ncbi:hypothetical protein PCASD_01990 [Puccinia coronata f. sp. avenae]|nr:hypothetical protein PCASD_12617 [Puccinia coronata f. sp. avenae]PLW49409.1 hypothetical protein PCASD_01990 [Puccinia coronata f. sp. avenae]
MQPTICIGGWFTTSLRFLISCASDTFCSCRFHALRPTPAHRRYLLLHAATQRPLLCPQQAMLTIYA